VTDSVDALVAQLGSADQDEQAQAMAGLVGAGRRATGPLVDTLRSADAGVRAHAAQALAEIGDPAAEATFRELLGDAIGTVRARGAQGLAAIGAAGAVDALAATIDELPDLLHYPYTLSVRALIAMGWSVVAAPVSRLLTADDPVTRARAVLVLRSLLEDPAVPPDVAEALDHFDPAADESTRAPAAADVVRRIENDAG
jgi:HEAT repeat protein